MHIVIVSFSYLPLRHVSMTRPSNFARELTARGHRVTVLTIDWSTEASPLPPPAPGGPLVIALDARAWFPDFRPDRFPLTTEPPPPASPILRRAQTLRRTLSFGQFESWGRAGLEALLAHHRRDPVDVVWAIHGSASCHEIAHRFSRRTGVPWVADFKDPWDLFHLGLIRIPQQISTARRLRSASALTETCAAQAVSDTVRFGLPSHVIWSGYEAEVMAAAPPERLSPSFTLAYVGGLAPQHDIASIGRLLDAWRTIPDKPVPLEFHILSNDTARLQNVLREARVDDVLRAHSVVPREQAYRIMKGADALLLLPATFFVPSGGSIGVKELEYLASGSPVLSLGSLLPELDEVTRGCPQLFEAQSAAEGAAFLRREAEAFRNGRPSPRRATANLPSVRKHAWPEKAADLERVFERVIAAR